MLVVVRVEFVSESRGGAQLESHVNLVVDEVRLSYWIA
jgi:hypothetical protein